MNIINPYRFGGGGASAPMKAFYSCDVDGRNDINPGTDDLFGTVVSVEAGGINGSRGYSAHPFASIQITNATFGSPGWTDASAAYWVKPRAGYTWADMDGTPTDRYFLNLTTLRFSYLSGVFNIQRYYSFNWRDHLPLGAISSASDEWVFLAFAVSFGTYNADAVSDIKGWINGTLSVDTSVINRGQGGSIPTVYQYDVAPHGRMAFDSVAVYDGLWTQPDIDWLYNGGAGRGVGDL